MIYKNSSFVLAQDIVETAIADGQFTTLIRALTAADLIATLKGPGPFTVFAPTDAAFAKLPPGVLDELLKPENKEKLAGVLKYHVISGNLSSADINRMTLPAAVVMLEGSKAALSKDGSTIKINKAAITALDVSSTNGLIHVIDSVLVNRLDIVETILLDENFKTLAMALTAADLRDTLQGTGPFTLFAPTDAAFDKLSAGIIENLLKPENKGKLADLLKHHVLAGSVTSNYINQMTLPAAVMMLGGSTAVLAKEGNMIKINGATLTVVDLLATNGLIHVIDMVLQSTPDIIETATTNGNFNTLIELLTVADLRATLRGPGPFTVFAPTDAAFAKLPAGTVDDLLKPENKGRLADLLKYHVISGALTSVDINNRSLPAQISTLAAIKLIVDKDRASIHINAAVVTRSDIEASNGIIHALDAFLLPLTDAVGTLARDGNLRTLMTALAAAGLLDTLKGEGPFTVFAPSDSAFAKLPNDTVASLLQPENNDLLRNILEYHVTSQLVTGAAIKRMTLPSSITMLAGPAATLDKECITIKINDANVTKADLFNTNGMIHIIDTVILPPLDVVQTAIIGGTFKTLVAALTAAELLSTLQSEGPFTIFAPSDAAFAKLPTGVLADWFKPENREELVSILKYHVVGCQSIPLADIQAPQNLQMLSGGTTTITKEGQNLKINGANIIETNVPAKNGVIHIVDTVLMMRITRQ